MPFPMLIARAAMAAESAGLRAAATAARMGGGRYAVATAGRVAAERAMHRPNLLSNLRGVGWDLQAWSALLEDKLPSVVHKMVVRAQGAPETHLAAVVHLSLATAFGLVLFSPRFSSGSAVSVTVNHTTNTVVVEFGYRSWSTADMIAEAGKQVLKRLGSGGTKLVTGGIKIASAEPAKVRDGVSDILVGSVEIGLKALADVTIPITKGKAPDWDGGQGTKNVTPAANGTRPDLPDNQVQQDKLSDENADRRKALDEAVEKAGFFSRALGAMSVYRLGRHTIKGGTPIGILDTSSPADRPEPFRDMVGQPILTRDAAANPAPPAQFGLDLRTLVAQVLHDPGVRPPMPMTDKGPPVVENEFLGK